MWVLAELRREWTAAGRTYTHDALFGAAARTEAPGFTIDLNAPQFTGRGDMMRKVAEACIARRFSIPSSHAGITRLILESLAESHADALTSSTRRPACGRQMCTSWAEAR